MKVWYDTEFWERGPGHPIVPISIGLVAEDGREFYGINADAPIDAIANEHPWLRENVLNQLPIDWADPPEGGDEDRHYPRWLDDVELEEHEDGKHLWTHGGLQTQVTQFLRYTPELELWGWYSSYDHLLLAQLVGGTMAQLPPWMPMWTNDLRQEVHLYGNPRLPTQAHGAHHALDDAKHLRYQHGFFNELLVRVGRRLFEPPPRVVLVSDVVR